MSNNTKGQVAMLDTSFLIRLLKEDDPLHKSALEYYQYLLENEYILFVSTIALAEYCVKGKLDEIPLDNLRVVPFNLDHSAIAGEFAATLFAAREQGEFKPGHRLIIPNDTHIQTANTTEINFYVSTINNAGKTLIIDSSVADLIFKQPCTINTNIKK